MMFAITPSAFTSKATASASYPDCRRLIINRSSTGSMPFTSNCLRRKLLTRRMWLSLTRCSPSWAIKKRGIHLDCNSDSFNTYEGLIYWGKHDLCDDKSQTYSVEGVNADLRHYLGRLARKSRCFSRRIKALKRAVDLFVHSYNERQLRERKYPNYPAHLIDSIPRLI